MYRDLMIQPSANVVSVDVCVLTALFSKPDSFTRDSASVNANCKDKQLVTQVD